MTRITSEFLILLLTFILFLILLLWLINFMNYAFNFIDNLLRKYLLNETFLIHQATVSN